MARRPVDSCAGAALRRSISAWPLFADQPCAHAPGRHFSISLSYDPPTGAGKTSADTDTYHGRFTKLVPNEQVIQVMEFETADPEMRGEMTVTYTLIEADGGTDVLAVHDNLPPGLPAADNETGWRMALAKLARSVQANAR